MSTKGSISVMYGDTVNYWAAGKLLLNGTNPYSEESVIELRNQAGFFYEFPEKALFQIMYPPWAIPIMLPLGLFAYPISRMLWLLFHIIIVLICADLIWQIYGGMRDKKIITYIITITFAPTIFVLGVGHITTLHLLGLVGFLYFLQHPHRGRWSNIAAGGFASLVLLKPQLLYLFLFALFLWTISKREWFIIAGGVLFISFSTLISIIFDPQIFPQYLETLSKYQLGAWATPTIGMLLRLVLGIEKEWLQSIPPLLGLIWFVFHWRKTREKWHWNEELPLIILVSYLTSPYMWTYDMVVFLIPIIAVIIELMKLNNKWVARTFVGFLFFISIATFLLHLRLSDFWFFWLSPVLLIWYLVGKKITKKNIRIPESAEQDLAQAAPN
ncbi:glycosyltransferase 87 family protein [Chloroflexota bacterium]